MASQSLTAKQERFAQLVAQGKTAADAYRTAYSVGESTKPESVWVMACRALASAKVASRVDELRAEAAERHRVTVDSLTIELEEARAVALEEGQPGAAVSATMGKAKLHGLLVDKVDARQAVVIAREDADL